MTKKALAKAYKRKIIASGQYSLSVTLPVAYLAQLGWEKGQEITIKIRNRRKQLILELPT